MLTLFAVNTATGIGGKGKHKKLHEPPFFLRKLN